MVMKKIILMLILGTLLWANDSIGWMDDFDAAKIEAKKVHKPIIVMFTTSWCHVCNMMKKEVFTDEGIIKKQRAHFVSVMLDKEFDDIPKGFEVFGTPTFYFLDENAKIVDMKVGGSNVMGWNRTLDKYAK